METGQLIQKAYQYIDENKERLLEDWFEIIRQPSVSATGEGVVECCELVAKKMRELGIDVKEYPIEPYPVLVGRYGNDSSKKTVLIYAHYDVKPAGKRELWNSDPFIPTEREGKIYARGSADNKSPLMAHLKALEFYKDTEIEVPVNVLYLFEGCEEEGSKGLPEFLDIYREQLKADLVFFSDGPKDPSGLPIIALGAKGNLNIKITVKTMNRNVHSRYAPVLPSAAWQLVELLGKLKKDDDVLVPGFYDGILEPKEKELEIIRSLPESESQLNKIYEAKSSNYGDQFYERLLTKPSFNICQIQCGANGVVPGSAEAILDIRTVEGQDGNDIFQKIKKYVADLGYDQAEVTLRSTRKCSKTDVETPYLLVIEKATKMIYGDCMIYPCRPSAAPDYLWTDIMKLPAIQVRWSDADSDNHAPNEHLSIKEYWDGIAMTIAALNEIGNMEN